MSSESFRAFMAKVAADQALRKEFEAAAGGSALSDDAVVAFAAGKGYAFKVEDISHELAADQLDKVSGGAYEFYLKIKGEKQGR